jgi:hypothetical protein
VVEGSGHTGSASMAEELDAAYERLERRIAAR